jgi:outer membrane protein assembly factor BamB
MKRFFVIILAVACLSACASSDEGEQTPRANLQRTGVYSTKAVSLDNVAWQANGAAYVESAPVVAAGKIAWGGRDRILRVNDLDSGASLWKAQLDGAMVASPSIVGENLYVPTDGGSVYNFHLESGRQAGQITVGSPVLTSPLVYKNLLVVGCRDGSLRAFDRVGGEQLWLLQTDGAIEGDPALFNNGVLYVTSTDGTLRAVDLMSGKEKWQFKVRGAFVTGPAVVDSVVYVGSRNRQFYAVDALSGKQLWRFRAGNEVHSSAAVTDELVIFGSYSNRVYAVSRKTGLEVWQFKTLGGVDSSPVVAGNTVYFGSRDKHVYALDLASGGLQSKWDADSWVMADPLPVVGGLLVAKRDGGLVKFQ